MHIIYWDKPHRDYRTLCKSPFHLEMSQPVLFKEDDWDVYASRIMYDSFEQRYIGAYIGFLTGRQGALITTSICRSCIEEHKSQGYYIHTLLGA